MDDVVTASIEFLSECMNSAEDWREVFENIEGKKSVKLMTIHKSKGLEFHTVVFLDLNDEAFWGDADDANVFFVALSRARERVIFSFRQDAKGFGNVKHLYELLVSSGVSFVEPQQST